MNYRTIDPMELTTWPLAERESKLAIEQIALDPLADPPKVDDALARQIDRLAQRLRDARRRGASRMLTYGAHLVKNGAGPLVCWLVNEGWIDHLATQGAGIIHDWEFAFAGVSSESVRDHAAAGRFGSWEETGRAINLAATAGAAELRGFGEAMGRWICEDGWALPTREELAERIAADPAAEETAGLADLLRLMTLFDLDGGRVEMRHPWKRFSIPAACWQSACAMTVHPGIGYDIYTNHPMFRGGGVGRASIIDVRRFAGSVDRLDGGVYLSVGSAIMSPQVFEKAFSAANNLRRGGGRTMLSDHFIGIVDIQNGGGWDWTAGEPPEHHPAYYLRFCKTFYRMGGTVDHLCGDNRAVLSQLIHRLRSES
jgi:hypothetical protein